MDNLQLTQIMLLVASFSVATLIFTVVWPHVSGRKQTEKRLNGVVESRAARIARLDAAQQGAERKQAVADTLKSIEEQQKKSNGSTLSVRLKRAGLKMSIKTFYALSVGLGLIIAGCSYVFVPNLPMVVLVAIAGVAAFGLPRWIVAMLVKRRQAKFINELPNAIDVIVRGAKTGLPVNECLAIVARENAEPLCSEFQEIVETQRVGMPLSEGFERLCARMPLPEVRFLAIVITIQQSAGGSLSEALGNLSKLLRARKQLAAKIGALSAEAKASAVVLGVLPFLVSGFIYMTNPDYLEPLLTTKIGQFMLGGALVWMFIGALVMRKMINFKY